MARRSFSPQQANEIRQRLRAAVDFEQDVTLSPDECYVLLAALNRLAYQAAGRTSLR